ncbi:AAA family ATPase [Geomonas anaerohicana]|uniref:AAA family ATPase n=1 Tax=Geomonas anaerohicana TaxID=2798583 RepID=A0ABS0YH74_9BACT|nr:AAA family ATPase [Geomonas anaerohicana]MBJ6751640.1 AAA family ATPase [Geomonas anaerohicana]
MTSQFSIAIIDEDKPSRDALLSSLKPYADSITLAGSIEHVSHPSSLQKGTPNVVFLGVARVEQGIKDIRTITAQFPRASVIACSSEKNVEGFLALMRAGAVEYLLRPIGPEELNLSLQKVSRLLFAATAEEPAPSGKILAVYNPVGGMGTTTVAVNLAAALAAEGGKVALVDLNLEAGDVNTFLNLNPAYTLSSVTTNIDRLDADFLMSVMTRHASGPYILTEPLEVDEAVSITPDQIQRMLELLKKMFTYVVVDCAGLLAGCNVTILDSAELILFNTTLSLPGLKNTKRYLLALANRGHDRDRVKLVINRYLPKSDIQLKDAEKVLEVPVYQAIPNNYADVVSSVNKGMPVVQLLPKSPVTKAILGLAERVKR